MPVPSGSVDLEQRFPAAMGDFAVIVKKVGDTMAGDWEKRAGPDGTAVLQQMKAK